MAIAVQLDYQVDLCEPVHLIHMDVPFFVGDQNAHRFHVKLARKGCAIDVSGIQVTGYMVRADKQTVIWDGEADGCDLYLTMPAACYAVPGRFRLLLRVTLGDTIETALWVEGAMIASATDVIVDPGEKFPSLEEMLKRIEALEKGSSTGGTGYTPIRGVDYWTEADQEAIVQQVLATLGTSVIGTVDTDNTIILSGNLADGVYTLKYEDADGNQIDVGTIEVSSTGDPDEPDVPVTPSYTNLIDTVGYSDGYRLSGSSGTAKEQEGCVTTGFIPITAVGDVIRTSGVIFDEDATGSSGWCYFGVYDNNQSLLGINSITPTTSHAANVSSICDADGNATITVNAGATLPGYIRLSGVGSGANLIVTKNEEIK